MSTDRKGQIVDDRYEILGTLGAGSFGTVYEAEQINTKQRVALKLLRLQETSEEERQLHLKRFKRECRLCGELSHPHIVRLLDSGEAEGLGPFLVFEKVEGRTLADVLKTDGLGIAEATWLMTQVLDALAYAHRLGIIHRDIKPQNIMITQGGLRPSAVILDFGIGGYIDSLRRSESATVLTENGGLGTPAYADREQLKGVPVANLADIYSWGLVFVECIQKRRVVHGEGYQQSLFNHLKQAEHVIDEPLRSTELGKLLSQTIRKDPKKRPQDAETVYEALKKCANLQSPTAFDGAERRSLDFDHTSLVPRVRRQVTVITGILGLRVIEGVEVDSDAFDRAFQHEMSLLLQKANDIGAYVFSVLADKFILLVSYPEAISQEGMEALRIVTLLREASNRRHSGLIQEHKLGIDLRFAIHTGFVTAPMEVQNLYDFGGATFNVAARLCSKVEEGQCLISESTYRLLSSTIKGKSSHLPPTFRGISLTPRDEFDLGLEQPVRIYELSRSVIDEPGADLGAMETLDGIEQVFVGRQSETQTIKDLWKRTRAGKGQGLLLYGEAGIGKSRMVRNFARYHSNHARILWVQAYPDRQTSFYQPLIEAIEQLISEVSSKSGRRFSEQALGRFLAAHDMDAATWSPILKDLLTLQGSAQGSELQLSPPLLKEKRMELLLTLVSRLAGEAPLIVAVEDLHYADPQTVEFVSLLLEELHDQPIFCLMTARPVFSPPWAPARASQLQLQPLSDEDTDSLIVAQLGVDDVSPKIVQLLRSSSDGVPLFVEELTQTVLDLQRRGDDVEAVLKQGSATSLSVPRALYGGLMSRIDSLGKETQQVLRAAAVLGREFSTALLSAVMNLSEPQLKAHLETLKDKHLLFHLRSRRVGERYTFKHALLQQIAYNSLPHNERVEHHLNTAMTLESSFPKLAMVEPGVLRHHFHLGENAVKAVSYSIAVVKQAQRISAEDVAYEVLQESIAWLDAVRDPEERFGLELEVYATLLLTLVTTTGYGSPETSDVLDHLGEMVEGLEAVAEVYPIRSARMTFFAARGDHKASLDLGEENLVIARRLNDPAALFDALVTLGGGALQIASLNERADALLTEAWTFIDDVDDDHFLENYGLVKGVALCIMMASLKTRMGKLDEGELWFDRAITLARDSGHVHSQGLAIGMGIEHVYARGDSEGIVKLCEDVEALTQSHGLPFWEALISIPNEWALLKSGSGSLEKLKSLHDEYLGMGMKIDISLCASLVADAALAQGEVEDAEQWITRALHEADTIPELTFKSDLLRVKGDVLRAKGDTEGAIAAYQEGIDLTQAQGDHLFGLSNAHKLAELLEAEGRPSDAREVLTASIALFDGKGDCPRLQAARSFLAQL